MEEKVNLMNRMSSIHLMLEDIKNNISQLEDSTSVSDLKIALNS